MKIAVCSDSHGNAQALEAVLTAVRELGITRLVHVGDAVGYGGEPERVVQMLRDFKALCVAGNHERGLVSAIPESRFNSLARKALCVSRALTSMSTKQWAASLPDYLVMGQARFVHGAPPASVSTYLFTLDDHELEARLGRMKERICFCGHTHLLQVIGTSAVGLVHHTPKNMAPVNLSQGRYVVNVGSVGQPRDEDVRARFVVFDPQSSLVVAHAVDYDHQAAAQAILAAGMPACYADRLLGGGPGS